MCCCCSFLFVVCCKLFVVLLWVNGFFTSFLTRTIQKVKKRFFRSLKSFAARAEKKGGNAIFHFAISMTQDSAPSANTQHPEPSTQEPTPSSQKKPNTLQPAPCTQDPAPDLDLYLGVGGLGGLALGARFGSWVLGSRGIRPWPPSAQYPRPKI